MSSASANCAAASAGRFPLEERGVQVGKVLQLQSGNFLADEMFNRLQRGQLVAAHECESVAHILGASRPPDAVHIIFRMLRHIVVDDVAYPGDVESARC